MTPVLFLLSVAGITSGFVARARRGGSSGLWTTAGAVPRVSGLVTAVLLVAHIASVSLRILTQSEPAGRDLEQFLLLTLGVAIFIPGLICVSQAGALTRGELYAQKRSLAAAIVVLGFTLPLALFQPLAALMSLLALLNVAILLSSRTNLEISEPLAS